MSIRFASKPIFPKRLSFFFLLIKENMYIIAHNNMSNNKYKYLGSSNLNILFKLL